ncbi:MAG: hypothetical protein COV75_04435 [Candidatus Omnitrophica bacterium CG11_big_fil_rev_8_21_14_0_20_63_9]|nr:MAG: hypothetical protein COV75_04435 [Candidatus Omnitrophica bacterium CG11_big_fil_rev_8_21_14_0_20_63_9]
MRWMKRRFQTCLLIACLCLPLPTQAFAGAWTVPRNRWYAEYFARYLGSKKEFDARRNTSRRAKSASFRDIRHELKLEYGLTDWWNVLASVPYQSSHYQDSNIDLLNANVGDIHVRTKLRWLTNPVVGSVQFSVKIPSAYDPLESPGLGDGQVDFDTRLQLSRSWMFGPQQTVKRRRRTSAPPARTETASQPSMTERVLVERDEAMQQAVAAARRLLPETPAASLDTPRVSLGDPEAPRAQEEAADEMAWAEELETRYDRVAFVNVEGGFTARNEDPANEVPLVFEAGFTPLRRLMLVGSLESVFSIKSTNEAVEDFSKVGLRGIFNVWGDGFASVFRDGGPTVNVELGYTDIVAGRNTSDSFEVFGKIGVFF